MTEQEWFKSMKWFFKITTNMWPVFVANSDLELAKQTLEATPGGHVFGPFTSADEAVKGADIIMGADEYAIGH